MAHSEEITAKATAKSFGATYMKVKEASENRDDKVTKFPAGLDGEIKQFSDAINATYKEKHDMTKDEVAA
jgi:hypothetical protein